MKKDFPYLGCVLLIAAFVVEVLALYFIVNIFVPFPWWAAFLVIVALNIGVGIYRRIKPRKAKKK